MCPQSETLAETTHAEAEPAQPQLQLVVAWCAHDPSRVGEVIVVPRGAGTMVLGRGVGDGENRARLLRARPGEACVRPPLEDERISRFQLEISARSDRISLRNVGRRSLWIDGVKRDVGDAAVGSQILLGDRLLLLVEWQQPFPAGVRSAHRFGDADEDGIVGESARGLAAAGADRPRGLPPRPCPGAGSEWNRQGTRRPRPPSSFAPQRTVRESQRPRRSQRD